MPEDLVELTRNSNVEIKALSWNRPNTFVYLLHKILYLCKPV
jgi:hypothetical protein